MKNKFDFKNPEDFRRAEHLSYDGTLDVSDFPPAEYKYFGELCKVYHAFKSEELTKSDAEKQKAVLLRRYRENLKEHEDRLEVYRCYQQNIRTAEMLMTEIQKSHDVHDIAVTAVKAVGLMTHDETFIKTNTAKLEALR
ncbi:MAG: hypothetical protein NC177_07555 [Ruminococcus flavefaciens]|nr:hypothetical protein [Ruminococcus flavefaciens]